MEELLEKNQKLECNLAILKRESGLKAVSLEAIYSILDHDDLEGVDLHSALTLCKRLAEAALIGQGEA